MTDHRNPNGVAGDGAGSDAGDMRSPNLDDLAELWSDLFPGTNPVLTSNFFSLGGDSLAALRMVGSVREKWGVPVRLATLLKHPVLADFHREIIRAQESGDARPIMVLPPGSEVRVAHNQAIRLALDEEAVRTAGSRFTDNISLAFAASGSLDVGKLSLALERLAQKHAVLRSRFPGGNLVDIMANHDVPLETEAADGSAALQRLAEHGRTSFDAARRPPWSVLLVQRPAAGDLLSLCFDHLLLDRESIPVLLADLAKAYEAPVGQDDSSWTPLTPSYYDWAAWQRDFATDDALRIARESIPLGGDLIPTLLLSGGQGGGGANRLGLASREVPEAVMHDASDWAVEKGITRFQLFLVAYVLTLDLVTDQRTMGIVVPIANRETPETAALVGWVSSLGCLRLVPHWEADLSALMGQIRHAMARAIEIAAVPARIIEEELAGDKRTPRRPRAYFDFAQGDDSEYRLGGVDCRRLELPGQPYLMPGLSLWASQQVSGTVALDLGFDQAQMSQQFADSVLRCCEIVLEELPRVGESPLTGLRSRLMRMLPEMSAAEGKTGVEYPSDMK